MGAASALVALCAVVFVATRPSSKREMPGQVGSPATDELNSGAYSRTIEILEDRLNKEPCDRQQMLSLGEALTKAGNMRRVIDRSEVFWKKCGPFPQLRWYTYGAHKRLSELDAAIADATELIKNNPNDKDFWWWRGIAYEETGQLEKAASDFRQTITLQPRVNGIPFNLAAVYEKLGKPCEAIFPIEQFLRYYPDVSDREAVDQRLLRLYANPECTALAGTGRAIVRFQPGSVDIRTAATLGDTHGTFVVDTGASYTALTSRLAEKLALKVTSRIRVHTAAGIVEGGLATLDSLEVQGAKARRIPVVVLDVLPPGVDGLLGLSFLSRFNLQMESISGKLTISDRGSILRRRPRDLQ